MRSQGTIVEADASAISEQQLGIELLRNMEREQPGTYAHFSEVMYQKTSGKEVDFCDRVSGSSASRASTSTPAGSERH